MGQIFIQKTFESKLACHSKGRAGGVGDREKVYASKNLSAIVNILALESWIKSR